MLRQVHDARVLHFLSNLCHVLTLLAPLHSALRPFISPFFLVALAGGGEGGRVCREEPRGQSFET